jgi:hypothetical protein
MWQKVKKIFSKPIDLFTSRGNTLIIQAYPKKNVLYVSYKGKVKTAYFHDETMRHMLKGGQDFDKFKKHTDRFLTAVGQLIAKNINE